MGFVNKNDKKNILLSHTQAFWQSTNLWYPRLLLANRFKNPLKSGFYKILESGDYILVQKTEKCLHAESLIGPLELQACNHKDPEG